MGTVTQAQREGGSTPGSCVQSLQKPTRQRGAGDHVGKAGVKKVQSNVQGSLAGSRNSARDPRDLMGNHTLQCPAALGVLLPHASVPTASPQRKAGTTAVTTLTACVVPPKVRRSGFIDFFACLFLNTHAPAPCPATRRSRSPPCQALPRGTAPGAGTAAFPCAHCRSRIAAAVLLEVF